MCFVFCLYITVPRRLGNGLKIEVASKERYESSGLSFAYSTESIEEALVLIVPFVGKDPSIWITASHCGEFGGERARHRSPHHPSVLHFPPRFPFRFQQQPTNLYSPNPGVTKNEYPEMRTAVTLRKISTILPFEYNLSTCMRPENSNRK